MSDVSGIASEDAQLSDESSALGRNLGDSGRGFKGGGHEVRISRPGGDDGKGQLSREVRIFEVGKRTSRHWNNISRCVKTVPASRYPLANRHAIQRYRLQEWQTDGQIA